MNNIFKTSILMLSILAVVLTSCDTASTLVATDPTIKGLDVYNAKAGEVVTIYGEGFGSATDTGELYFGDVKATIDIVGGWTDTKIKVKVPADFKKDTLIYIQITNGTKKTTKWDFYVGDATPKNFEATSKDSSSVLLVWDKSPMDKVTGNTNVFDHYHLMITDDKGTSISGPDLEVLPGVTSYTVKNLKAGTIYDFELRNGFKNDTMSTASRIKWSPAFRFTNTTNGVAIKLYESASTSFGSGLDLYDASLKATNVLKIADCDKWNLGINTKGGKLVFGSASDLGYNYSKTPENAEMSTAYGNNSLDEITDNVALSIKTFSATSFDLDNLETQSPTTGYVFVVRVGPTPYNYAKVLVKRTDGKILQGTSPNRYIELEVSYQTKSGVPYAKH